ncbi:MAG: sulfatase-like hydrolase/transferase, partial [Solirubrobacterales bacterium]|nr:sulfatase-like hydrolase/transferase [Solirubrobacterales bacterium]
YRFLMHTDKKVTRGQLLKGAAAAAPAVMLGGNAAKALAAGGAEASAAAAGFGGKNVILFMTDQERAIQHFPKGWADKNLPAQKRLAKNGMTFTSSFTNACMCSPARTTMMTGFMPAQHQVRHTLESDMNNTFDSEGYEYPNVPLSTETKNMCTVMAAAGYNVVWKGKFHMTKQAVTPPSPLPAAGTTAAGTVQDWTPENVGQYGGQRWNPKDAGANQTLPEGGGNAYANPDPAPGYTGGANDKRFMKDAGSVSAGDEGVLAYINSVAATQTPFFLVISLVNPHDVLFYPKSFKASKYPSDDLDGDIELPSTVNENLKTKPKVQSAFRKIFLIGNPILTRLQQRKYINFYGNLMKEADDYLNQTLNLLEKKGLLDDTVIIRTADHGEMGMAHDGVGEKNFNFYEESMKVPLIWSNPQIFPKPRTSDALVSHVDLVPTLASVFGAPSSARANWNGVDYSKLLVNPKAKSVQDYVMFTYDDYQSGQASKFHPYGANHISSIREARYKIARYYDPLGVAPTEYEMYDLQRDPSEKRNLAAPGIRRGRLEQREFSRLKKKLTRVEATRLGPIPGTPQTISMTASTSQTKNSETFKFTDKGTCIGMPTGSGNTLIDWVLDPVKGTGAGKVTLSSGAGLIKGVATVTFVADPAADQITLTGTMTITSGTGDFRGIKATGLTFVETDNLQGTDGQITITGNATYQ